LSKLTIIFVIIKILINFRRDILAISLKDDAKKQAIQSIKRYTAENYEEEFGDLKANLLLDFFLLEIGPSVYNQAISDAQAYFQDKVIDLDGTCYEPEFGYWK
jgi:uncharacterized protein (DUF2164 family)